MLETLTDVLCRVTGASKEHASQMAIAMLAPSWRFIDAQEVKEFIKRLNGRDFAFAVYRLFLDRDPEHPDIGVFEDRDHFFRSVATSDEAIARGCSIERKGERVQWTPA
jgi:hypothetical protein